MNLPPMTHADAGTITGQLRLMGTAWWAMLDGAQVAEAEATVSSAAIYWADYATMLENRMMEPKDQVAELAESNQELSHTLRKQLELEQARAAHPSSQPMNLLPWQQQMLDQLLAGFAAGQVPVVHLAPQRGQRSVEWRGAAGDYWKNAEAINRAIAQEFFNGTIDGEPPELS